MELKKTWNDGGSLTATYEGSGDGSAVFSSDTNEGIDREMSVFFKGAGRSIERVVKQEGLREEIRTADGLIFRASDGYFGVLKEATPTWRDYYKEVEYLESTGKQYLE